MSTDGHQTPDEAVQPFGAAEGASRLNGAASSGRPSCCKVRFDTLDAAELTLADVRHERGRPKGRNVRKVERRAYLCPSCNGYHLTSAPARTPSPPVTDGPTG